jgi:hypothetical protein
MIRFGQLMIVHFDESLYSLLYGAELKQCHFVVFPANEKFIFQINILNNFFIKVWELTGKI